MSKETLKQYIDGYQQILDTLDAIKTTEKNHIQISKLIQIFNIKTTNFKNQYYQGV